VKDTSIQESRDKVRGAAESVGIDPDEMQSELDEQIADQVERSCMVKSSKKWGMWAKI